MAADSSNASTTVTLNMTTTFDDKPVKNVAKWINTMIIILGLITNTLILVILSRRKIGSKYWSYKAGFQDKLNFGNVKK